MFAPPGRTDRRRARPLSEQAPLSSFQSCSRCHALRSHRLLNVNTGRPIVPRTGKFHFSGMIVAASSLAAASIEDSEHVGADERHAAFAAGKGFRVQFGVFADHEPFSDAAAAIDDHFVEPRATTDMDVREQYRLAR